MQPGAPPTSCPCRVFCNHCSSRFGFDDEPASCCIFRFGFYDDPANCFHLDCPTFCKHIKLEPWAERGMQRVQWQRQLHPSRLGSAMQYSRKPECVPLILRGRNVVRLRFAVGVGVSNLVVLPLVRASHCRVWRDRRQGVRCLGSHLEPLQCKLPSLHSCDMLTINPRLPTAWHN